MPDDGMIGRGRAVDRRSFLAMAGSAWLAGLCGPAVASVERTAAIFASAFMDPDGLYGVAVLAEDGTLIDRITLPARAHGLASSPQTGLAVAFARRPGIYAVVFSPERRSAPVLITAAEGRHFFGHGCFSPDGRLLYATENDFDAGRGMIGVYDGTDGFRRIGEFPTHGIGPHDLVPGPVEGTLAVANGGIATHPDFGRTKLNLDQMEPSLALIDCDSGALLQRHPMPAGLAQLSTRHLETDDSGRIWFACQFEGPRNELPPLVGHFSPGGDLRFLDLPEETTRNLANYVGAIAINRREGLIGLTSPTGNRFVSIDAGTGRVLLDQPIIEAAGIAPAREGFAVSTYRGRFAQVQTSLAFDQHIRRLAS